MKYLTKTCLLIAAILILAIPILTAVRLVNAAGSAKMYLSPSSTSVVKGSTLNVEVHEDSGSDLINTAQVSLNYSSNLTYTGAIDSSDFGIDAQTGASNGTFTTVRAVRLAPDSNGVLKPVNVSGDKIIVTLKFTANDAGTASISFGGSTFLFNAADSQKETLTTSPATYNIIDNSASAVLSLSPASQTLSAGATFNVGVYEDSGSTGVNSVQANLSYPANLLSFVSISSNPSVWPIDAVSSGGNGSVNIVRGIAVISGQPPTPLTGKQLVATVVFKAIAAGAADVNFGQGSSVFRASDGTTLPSTNNRGVYTVVNPSGTGGKSSSAAGKTASGSKASPQTSYTHPSSNGSPVTTSPPSTAGPVISGIKVTRATDGTVTITWQTSEAATSEIKYGLSTNLILNKIDDKLTTSHSISLSSKELVPHKTFHFKVLSVDALGNQSSSDDQTFSTGSSLSVPKVAAISAGAVVVGATIWAVATGFGGFTGLGGAAGAGSGSVGGGTYTAPKPLIVGGGTPPPPPSPVVQPQAQAPKAPQAPQTPQKPTTIIKGEDPQTPGEVITPKTPPK
jgi:hypothetical protein